MRNGEAPPYEMLVLMAAKGDPLRAQEIEERLAARWWGLWLVYHEELKHAR